MKNIAFIGCGRIADLHARGYAGSTEARIHALCDTNPDLLKRRQLEWQAEKTYQSYADLLEDPAIDALEILTPQLLHEEMVIQAARAGKHVALQKPMTIDLRSADRMLRAVEDSGIIFKITENYVFYPPIVRARQLIDAGAIGRPLSLRIRYIGGSGGGWEVPATAWEWRLKEAQAGRGMITFDHGHHLWSTAWYLLGEIEEVQAWMGSGDGLSESPSMVMWRYKKEHCMGMCDIVQADNLRIPSDYYANDEWIEITGQAGIIVIRRCTGKIQDQPVLAIYTSAGWKEEDLPSDWGLGFTGASQNFFQALHGRSAPLLSGKEARDILRFSLALRESVRKNRSVFLEELDSSWPWWHRRRVLSKRKRLQSGGGGISSILFPQKTTIFADQADALTLGLLNRFDARQAGDWQTIIALDLLADEGKGAGTYTLYIEAGQARLEKILDPAAVLTVSLPAGLWAAILLGKRRIETAALTGKLKLRGRAEEGLRLRTVFGL